MNLDFQNLIIMDNYTVIPIEVTTHTTWNWFNEISQGKMPKTTVVFHQDVVNVVNLANSQYFYTVPNTTLMYQYNGCNLNCKLKDCNSVVFLNPVSVQSL